MLMYTTKDIYKPVIIAPLWNETTGILSIYATSDQLDQVQGEAVWEWITFDGEVIESAPNSRQNFTIGSVNSTEIASWDMSEIKDADGFEADDAILVASLTASGSSPTKTLSHSNLFTATPLSKAKLVDPGLEVEHSSGKFTVTATEGVSAFTWIAPDVKDSGIIVVFDDNGFLLRAERRNQNSWLPYFQWSEPWLGETGHRE